MPKTKCVCFIQWFLFHTALVFQRFGIFFVFGFGFDSFGVDFHKFDAKLMNAPEFSGVYGKVRKLYLVRQSKANKKSIFVCTTHIQKLAAEWSSNAVIASQNSLCVCVRGYHPVRSSTIRKMVHTCHCFEQAHCTPWNGVNACEWESKREKVSKNEEGKKIRYNWLRYRTLRKIFMMSNYCNFRIHLCFLAAKMWEW